MIIQETNKWLAEFKKKFINFCEKAPIILSFNLSPTEVILFEQKYNSENTNLLYTFQFDYSKNVQSNIAEIKKWLLENKYPIMIKQETLDKRFTSDEMQILIDKQIGLDDILKQRKIIKETKMRIEKLIIKRNEFHIRNLETNELNFYYLDIPSVLFLTKLSTMKPVDAWEMFNKKAKLLNKDKKI